MPACILPVAAVDAFQWARGKLSDRDLLLKSRLAAEFVFVVDLPDVRAWRGLVTACRHWHRAGAVGLIMRTGTPLIRQRMQTFGGLATLHEATTPPKSRYLIGPAEFSAWIASLPGSAQ